MKNFTAYLLALLTCTLLINGCQPAEKEKVSEITFKEPGFNSSGIDSNKVVIWKDPDASDQDFNHFIDSLLAANAGYQKKLCENCDGSLVEISGSLASRIFNASGTPTTGGNGGKGSGPSGDGLYYWSVNFPILTSDPVVDSVGNTKPAEVPAAKTYKGEPVVVGVLDTGVDPRYLASNGALFNGATLPVSCLGPLAQNGWNFPAVNSNVTDDYSRPTGHGATVAALIVEQGLKLARAPIRILPVKIISESGGAKFFDVLCAIAYAKNRGAKIINASFGYYYCAENDADGGDMLFKAFIKRYLTDNNIIMVAAAGNILRSAQFSSCDVNERNLEKTHFYPASFAGENGLPNVFAVTTVYQDETDIRVAPLQNFSSSVVDVGVMADVVSVNDVFAFKNPRFVGATYVVGSSYATPIFTGKLAACYHDVVTNGTSVNKTAILKELKSLGAITTISGYQTKKLIRDGNITSK